METHLQYMFLAWFEFVGLGNQKTLLSDPVDGCVV